MANPSALALGVAQPRCYVVRPVPAPESETFGDLPVGDLLQALRLLNRRGTGALAWAAPFRDDPIAFLLDSMSDAIHIWNAAGELLFQNRAAAALGVERGGGTPLEIFTTAGRRFERRALGYRSLGVDYLVEIIREVSPRPLSAAAHASTDGSAAARGGSASL